MKNVINHLFLLKFPFPQRKLSSRRSNLSFYAYLTDGYSPMIYYFNCPAFEEYLLKSILFCQFVYSWEEVERSQICILKIMTFVLLFPKYVLVLDYMITLYDYNDQFYNENNALHY